ncbi:hypothetical protein PoB_006786800 [Plakobranchus ocellatus]|uniref:Uncharacterized protein n=1 Tax=Plakobranchus ocellatus TaxID=259542 RepID=A0AAV4DBE1_9GAST|nr:hypothetical protein PoB_006786800 [Plakobranchus ocellatus]
MEMRALSELPRPLVLSGNEKDKAFELRKHELESLGQEHKRDGDIRLAVQHSQKGCASRILMSLRIGASVDDIPTKLQDVFGPMDIAHSIMRVRLKTLVNLLHD